MSQLTVPPLLESSLELLLSVGGKSHVVPLIAGTDISIGRGEHNLVRLDYGSVSRAHAVVRASSDGVEVEDLGSSNGTVLIRDAPPPITNEQVSCRLLRLPAHERKPLQVNDVLSIGPALLRLQRVGPEPVLDAQSQPAVLIDPQMCTTYQLAQRAAAAEIPVLIVGETGAGKETLARAIHGYSPRRKGPFRLLNCAELSKDRLPTELSEQAAFRGGSELFESARGGTLFLDEVDELPLEAQAWLLSVIDDPSAPRSRTTRREPADILLVTATSRLLASDMHSERVTSDFHRRISGVVLDVPPLRKRPLELEPLARHFLQRFCSQFGRSPPVLGSEALDALHAHHWPGNLRELKNVMERAALLAGSGQVLPEHVAPDPELGAGVMDRDPDLEAPTQRSDAIRQASVLRSATGALSQRGDGLSAAEAAERERALQALRLCAGNQTRAAKMLGIPRSRLIDCLERWNVPRPKKR